MFLDHAEHLLQLQRLVEEIIGARLGALAAVHLHLGVVGIDDAHGVRAFALHCAQHIDAVALAQLQVDDGDVVLAGVEQAQRHGFGVGPVHVLDEREILQVFEQHASQDRRVFDQQYAQCPVGSVRSLLRHVLWFAGPVRCDPPQAAMRPAACRYSTRPFLMA
ncbi:hypothetical protein D3C72_1844410 [compost metagenome]